jgi:hypothetical protein
MDGYVKISDLILWLKGEKYGYFLDDKITWVNYGDLEDEFPYDENDKQWELSRNRFIEKLINRLIYDDISKLVVDYNDEI